MPSYGVLDPRRRFTAGTVAGAPARRTTTVGGSVYAEDDPNAQQAAAAQGNIVPNAQRTGQAQGTQAGTALQTLREYMPDLFAPNSSSSSYEGVGALAPGAGGGAATHVAGPNFSAGADTAFLRAKDLAGQTARSALTSLRSSLGARGGLGGGLESKGTERIIADTAGQLTDVAREQAIQETQGANAAEMARYSGDITQRGQDLSAEQEAGRMGLASRQQAQSERQARYDQIMRALAALAPSY